ncbi:alpha/beta fold hydrolase [Nocardia higoensis]|uniref:Alpha/beta fold hydrolase n=1 Tax=Nocardia higoensis TaxID=228599 RepID=A0ABS0D3D4_9NOCA|nr:alpha/beta fold hydrolase [Nocardia higoensis]MBF6353007.1 alpha/beta fold hydrolase [Nocardia higoensis]
MSTDASSDPLLAGRPAGAASLTAVLRRAHEAGALAEAIPVLRAAAATRSTFTSAADLPRPSKPLLVSEGALPVLVCVPSFLAGSGPHQFARLAASFERRSRAKALVLPGFERAGAVPADWFAAIDALTSAARSAADGEPPVLVGYSIGGVVAHAMAQRLEEMGRPVAGIVMIDTVDPGAEARAATFTWALGSVLDRDADGRLVTDDNLTAMGAYLGILQQWHPGPVATPVLMLRAQRRPGGADRPIWDLAATTVSVPADHFSIMEEDAVHTARAIEGWLHR